MTAVHEAPLKRERTSEPETLFTIDSPLLGRSNAENLLAAAAAGIALGFSPAEIAAGLESVDERARAPRAHRERARIHGPRGLRAQARRPRGRAQDGEADRGGGRRPRDRRVRMRRRPRQGEAPGDGPHRGAARRRGRRDVRQPALGGARSDPSRRARGRRGGRKDRALRGGPPRGARRGLRARARR